MNLNSNKSLIVFLWTLTSISFGLILEYYFGMKPCFWCKIEQALYSLITLTGLLGLFYKNSYIDIAIKVLAILLLGVSSFHLLIDLGILTSKCSFSSLDQVDFNDLKELALSEKKVPCSDAKIFGVSLIQMNFANSVFLTSLIFKRDETNIQKTYR